MQDTPLSDLPLQIAHSGYLYMHAGACEHMIVVQDVRLLHADDPLAAAAAPTTTFLKRPYVRRCCICATRPACKVAHGDDLAPTTPAFFCDQCFDALHMPVDGADDDEEDDSLVVYPYLHE
jgi:snRNA-activating protein complex subunit 3